MITIGATLAGAFVVSIILWLRLHRIDGNMELKSKLGPDRSLLNVSSTVDAAERYRLSLTPNVYWPTIPSPENVEGVLKQHYPVYRSLMDVVTEWNPDLPENPSPVFKEELFHFNYSNERERSMAIQFRNAEVPFKIYDIPELDRISALWTDQYLSKSIDYSHVERSKDNHFMFWKLNSWKRSDRDYKPPTEVIQGMTFDQWVAKAYAAEATKLSNSSEHYYFMANAPIGDRTKTFIARDLNFFATDRENFFISNVKANKGIQCRFGMRGIIAESHYDTGRNMIAVIRGVKRYIINPPSECIKLDIIPEPEHPSYRHSKIDWSDLNQARKWRFDQVKAIDTIVRQGEVLYIPSFW